MVVLLTISGCGNTLYRKNIRDYTNVTSIEGLKFELPSDVLENCTMISEIDQDIDYSDGTYLYKNGTDTYILFSINAVGEQSSQLSRVQRYIFFIIKF